LSQTGGIAVGSTRATVNLEFNSNSSFTITVKFYKRQKNSKKLLTYSEFLLYFQKKNNGTTKKRFTDKMKEKITSKERHKPYKPRLYEQ
jgi:hypothetical protein